MGNARLEFYRFRLNPKKRKEVKTFKDFYFDEIAKTDNDEEILDETVLQGLFTYFTECLDGEHASDPALKKHLKVVADKGVNKYHSRVPKLDKDKRLIYGVINGGTYGLLRILADMRDKAKASELTEDDVVLSYFFFLLYLPIDHNEGSFIVHSNGKTESITTMFKLFIANIFGGGEASSYYKAKNESFSPKEFQDEFRRGAKIGSVSFRETFLPRQFGNRGLDNILGEFEITVKAVAKSKDVDIGVFQRVQDFFSGLVVGKENTDLEELGGFGEKNVELINDEMKSRKTFEWSALEAPFVPSINLDGLIEKFNEDGTPDFGELTELCLKYHEEMVLPEIRKDLVDGE